MHSKHSGDEVLWWDIWAAHYSAYKDGWVYQSFQKCPWGGASTSEHVDPERGFPGGASGKELTCQCRRHKICGFNHWVKKIPWRKKWQLPPVFLLGNPMDRGAWQACIRIDRIRFHSCSTANHGLCVLLIVGLGKNKKWKFLQASVSCVCT